MASTALSLSQDGTGGGKASPDAGGVWSEHSETTRPECGFPPMQ
jgi:hypothetical protein